MAFVKLDCGILNSTLWLHRDGRDIFITALLMAVPHVLDEPTPQLHVDSLQETGFIVPPDCYGFVPASGQGIIRMAMLDLKEGMEALRMLGEPDPESRTPRHEGRRLVRVAGGYIVLNFEDYRQKDATARDRAARYRERQRSRTQSERTLTDGVESVEFTRDSDTVTRDERLFVTKQKQKQKQIRDKPPHPPAGGASVDNFEAFWAAWPSHRRKVAKAQCLTKWRSMLCDQSMKRIMWSLEACKKSRDWAKDGGEFIPAPIVWLNQRRWEAPPEDVKSLTTPPTESVDAYIARVARERQERAAEAAPAPFDALAAVRKRITTQENG